MFPDSTPPEVRAWIHSAQLLLRHAEPSFVARAYHGDVLISAADQLRVENGQCPPILRRN